MVVQWQTQLASPQPIAYFVGAPACSEFLNVVGRDFVKTHRTERSAVLDHAVRQRDFGLDALQAGLHVEALRQRIGHRQLGLEQRVRFDLGDPAGVDLAAKKRD